MLLATLVGMAMLAPVPAKFVRVGEGWQLQRGGQPYFVKGVGGTNRMDELVAIGGNSVRTWGAERAQRDLDAAQRRGLTVCLGIWLGHKSYFDYANAQQVRKQFDEVEAIVKKHKDHPALLFWALGNEMEINNDTPELWKAIEDLAQMVKRHDPNHPVITVVAEIGGNKIANIKKYAPSIDALGINAYGGLQSLPQRLKEQGWDKPFIVTEWGPLGPWERPRTAWGAALEQTSTEKAAFYRESYRKGILNQPQCVGGYAFLWGDKQEVTPTWFGMFLPETGERTGAVDVIEEYYSGKAPAVRVPEVVSLSLSNTSLAVGAEVQAKAVVRGGPNLRLRWVVRKEIEQERYAGEGEQRPDVVDGSIPSVAEPRFRVPRDPGHYRIYLYVYDGSRAATANVPFEVK